MKKNVLLLACLLCGSIVAKDTRKEVSPDSGGKRRHHVSFELKQGYFHPESELLQDMFEFEHSSGGYMIEGDARWRFWKGLSLEVNGGFFWHDGYALVEKMNKVGDLDCCCQYSCYSTPCTCIPRGCNYLPGECVKYKMGTAGVSLKYYFNWPRHKWFFPYLGAGAKGFFVRIRNGSSYVKECEDYNTAGGVVHAGILLKSKGGFFGDLFFDYLGASIDTCCLGCTCSSSSCEVRCAGRPNVFTPRVKIGGIFVGIGLGYEF